MSDPDPDHELRLAANAQARALQQRYDDLVPLDVLRRGFDFEGRRVSFGSFQRGIHRASGMKGPAALTLVTAPKAPGKTPAYADELDVDARSILYHYRAGAVDQPDNRALRAAFSLQFRSSTSTALLLVNTWSCSRCSWWRTIRAPGQSCWRWDCRSPMPRPRAAH